MEQHHLLRKFFHSNTSASPNVGCFLKLVKRAHLRFRRKLLPIAVPNGMNLNFLCEKISGKQRQFQLE